MSRQRLLVCPLLAVIVSLSSFVWLDAAPFAGDTARTWTFGRGETLTDWTIEGDVTIDLAEGREGQGGALRIGPGGKALLKLRDRDESGKLEIWVYDDGTIPEAPKARRVGPRWGLLDTDGNVVAIGILYASYLGGDEGYTATACDGSNWFDQLSWLGVKRGAPGWHKWALNFDAEEGLLILHNDKDVNVGLDAAKAGLQGFSAIAIWGDAGLDHQQTIRVDDLSVTLGGPVNVPPHEERDPYNSQIVAAELAACRPVHLYTEKNAPATPKLEDLPPTESVSQYGITWTFQEPARVGQFVGGDWYVVGPVTIKAIEPTPLYGQQIPRRELDHMDKERPADQRVRNGFMLNPPAEMKVAYDSGVRNWFDPALIQKLPVAMKVGDSLVSTISMPKNLVLNAQLRNKIERGVDDSSPIRTAAVLTCVGEPQPPDAFRPAFCDRAQKIYLARNIQRQLLPTVTTTPSIPELQRYIRFTQRPWVGTCFFGFEEPVENMPQYGLEYGRVSGICALLLCTDLEPERKEPLLVNYVQVGIDLGGMVRAGHPGWTGWGGHGSGREIADRLRGAVAGRPSIDAHQQVLSASEFWRRRTDRLWRLLDGGQGGLRRAFGHRHSDWGRPFTRQWLGTIRTPASITMAGWPEYQ